MLSHKHLLLFTALAAAALESHAAVVSLSAESAAEYALAHNPSLAAARIRIEEARGRVDAAGRRANPELEFELSQNVRSPEHGVSVAWMQKFPRTARLAIEKSISRAELAAATAEVADAGRRLAGEAREAAIRIVAIDEERRLLKQHIENTRELAAFLAGRAKGGEASVVDASLVELEARQLATEMLQLDAKKAALIGSIRPLLGVRPSDRLSINGALGDPKSTSERSANLAGRGDIQAARAAADAAKHRVELAKANRWEDFSAGISASHERTEDAPSGLERDTTVGLRFSLPLPIWNKNEGNIREATAAAQRLEKETVAVIALARAEAASGREAMDANANILRDIDEQLMPQARQIEQQLKDAFDAGQTSLTEVLRARGRRYEIESRRLEALRDWHIARAQFRTATGVRP